MAPHNSWQQLHKALEKTGKALQEITVETARSSRGDTNRLPASVFDQSLGLTHIMSTVFQDLTKLQLTLQKKPPQDRLDRPWDQDGLRLVLSAASNLRFLHIGLASDKEKVAHWDGHASDFQALFRNISYPKLETLSLDGVDSTAEELMEFLRNSHAVRCLILERFSLIHSFWIPTIQILRDTTQVTDLQLKAIGGLLANDDVTGEYIDVGIVNLARQMQEFFHRDQSSVFSPAEIEWFSDLIGLQENIENQQLFEAMGIYDSDDYHKYKWWDSDDVNDSDEWVDVESSDEESESD